MTNNKRPNIEFRNFDERVEIYDDYAKNSQRKRIELGFPLLDENIRGLRPGNILTLLAGTGVGKSAIAQNILQNYTRNTGELTIFFSLEMSTEEIFERELQMEFDLKGDEIESNFLYDSKNIKQKCSAIAQLQNNFITVTQRIDISHLLLYVEAVEKEVGRKVGLLCVDYLALLKNNLFEKEEYLRITDNMLKLKEYAKLLDIPIIVLSQVSRYDIKTSENLSLHSGKGSGEVENTSDILLTLEKTDIKSSKSNIELLKLSIQKNRRGKKCFILVEFNHYNLKMSESDLNYESD